MNGLLMDMETVLADAGCKKPAIETARRLLEAGQPRELIRFLRLCRCDLMDELHEKQRRVDRMDILIRQTEKTIPKKSR